MPDPAPPPAEDIVDRLLRREAEGLACLSEVLARREIERLRALIAAAPDLAKAPAGGMEGRIGALADNLRCAAWGVASRMVLTPGGDAYEYRGSTAAVQELMIALNALEDFQAGWR